MTVTNVTVDSHSISNNCGSWSGLQWQASGCAVNTYGRDSVTFTSSIPVGSRITAISGSVNANTSGVALTEPGHMSIVGSGGLTGAGTLRASSAITSSNTNYPFSVSGLDILVGATTFNGALTVTFLNKEDTYTSNHNLSVSNLTITYDPPSGNTLFFGSPF